MFYTVQQHVFFWPFVAKCAVIYYLVLFSVATGRVPGKKNGNMWGSETEGYGKELKGQTCLLQNPAYATMYWLT